MSFHFNIFSVTLLMSGVFTLLVAILILSRPINLVRWFAGLMTCIAVWSIAYSFELSSRELDQMLFWINVEYVGISFLPALWFFFIAKFIGHSEWLSPKNRFMIMLFPTSTLVLTWTNRFHNLHYELVRVDSRGPFPLLDITPGPSYYVHTVYFYFMLAMGMALLVYKFRRADIAFRRQSQIILFAAALPWLTNFLYLLGARPFGHIDLTPYAFTVTAVTTAYGLFRYRFLNIIPLAREKVLEEIREGILVLDNQARVIDLNPAMKNFLPAFLTEPIGEPVSDILPGHQKLQQLISEPSDRRAEVEISGRFYEVAVTPLSNRNASGGMILIFWDITERISAVRKIEQQAGELAELNQVKDRLFSIVAHDLRSPIANLSAMLSMMENDMVTPEEFKAMVPTLSRNVSYTYAMLENLLYWATSQLKGYTIHAKVFDLNKMVRDKVLLFEKRASDKGITLVNGVSSTVNVYADPDMISIVLRNLVSNGVKFCQAGDSITISAKVLDSRITICVADTGVGIDKYTANKLFTAERVSTKGTANEKGTGLGLKLSREFTERNGGKFWVESIPGQGSKFFLELRGDTHERRVTGSSSGSVSVGDERI